MRCVSPPPDVGGCLAAVGYDGALEVQNAAANNIIVFLYAGLPGLLTAGATVAMHFYRLEDKMLRLKRSWKPERLAIPNGCWQLLCQLFIERRRIR